MFSIKNHLCILASTLVVLVLHGVDASKSEAALLLPEKSFLTDTNLRSLQATDDKCEFNLVTKDTSCQALVQEGGGEVTKVVVDGMCNYNKDLGYYLAVCSGNDPTSSVKFLRAHCSNSDCSDCHEYVVGCDVGINECGFVSRNEVRKSSECIEREDPATFVPELSYGVLGNCAAPTCATEAVAPLPAEPCSWHMRTSVNCKEFQPTGPSQEIVADGQCRFNNEIGYHIAVCTERFKLALRRAHCKNPDCTGCAEFFTKCDFLGGECGWISRDFEYLSGQCFQIVDGVGERIFGYDFIGSCGSPTCEFTTDAIVPTIAPTKQPSITPGPTRQPTPVPTAFTVTPNNTPQPTPPPPPGMNPGTPQPTLNNPGTPQPTIATPLPTPNPTLPPTPLPTSNPTPPPTPFPTTSVPSGSPTQGSSASTIGYTTTMVLVTYSLFSLVWA